MTPDVGGLIEDLRRPLMLNNYGRRCYDAGVAAAKEKAEQTVRRLSETLESIASPGETNDYGWWTYEARTALKALKDPK